MRATSLQIYMVFAAGLLATGLWAPTALSGCTAAQSKVPERVTIFFSNETENELYRCGCHSRQAGGLSRRATVIATKEDAPELLVDAGNFSAKRPGNAYDEFKMDYLLKVYELLGYSALNVGPLEFNRGKKALLSLAERTGNRLTSANVVDETGALVLPPYIIAEVDGLKVGLVGLVTEQFRPNAEDPSDTLKTTEPVEALEAVWAELKKKSDIQILLTQLRDDENTQVLKAFPELDAVVGGPGWRQTDQMQPWEENGIPMAKVGTRGKYIGELTIDLDSTDRRNIKISEFSGQVTELGDSIPDNVEVEKVLEEFKERLRKGEVIQDVYEPHSEDSQFGYAGAIYCQQCHGEIYAGWLRTRHAQGFQTLAGKGEQNNPGCLECHTVGYSEPGGYQAKASTYLLANIQCESCHGPGSDHMVVAQSYKDGKVEKPTDWKVAIANTQKETCIQCHNPDNDPNWVGDVWPYEKLVPQIACSQWLVPQTANGPDGQPVIDPTGAQPATGAPATPDAGGTDKPATPPAAGDGHSKDDGHGH